MLIQRNFFMKPIKSNVNIAIGNFDGIHLGHKFIIEKLIKIKKNTKDTTLILSFNPHPVKVLKPEKWQKNILKFRTKYFILKSLGVDILFLLSFNKKFSEITAKEFITEILIKRLKANNILIGKDFRFGNNREGDTEMLLSYAKKNYFNVIIFEKRKISDSVISSSIIRNKLIKGEIEKANNFLGYCWEIDGRVTRGAAKGRDLGFPTANVKYTYQLAPSNGIYACWAKIENDQDWRMAAVSTGYRPQFNGKEKLLEVHFLKFSCNVYHKRIRVVFVKKIREEQVFDSENQLINQMNKDCKTIEDILKQEVISENKKFSYE